MVTESKKKKASAELLRRVLLDLLQAATVVHWPGADGLAVDDIVICYPQAIAAGEVPDWPELQSRFPELAGELHALRSAKGWLAGSSCRDSQKNTSRCNRDAYHAHIQGGTFMPAEVNQAGQEATDTDHCRLCRWLVSFATESGWYPVGEFLALDAAAAIERAVEVFGPGAAYQAEEIPWDAAPLSKACGHGPTPGRARWTTELQS